MAQTKRTRKKRKFFDVEMPVLGKETQLYGYDTEELNGRIIKYDLTRFLKGKNVILKLRVNSEKEKPEATPEKIEVMKNFLRKMIRKGSDYIEDSVKLKCKDAEVIVKPVLVTRKKVSRAVRKALREKMREEIKNYIKDMETDEIFDEIIKNKLQKPLSLELKKIYPLSLCEIRILEIENIIKK